ncbi:MAG: trypsin-like peptidase domain-containing protein [Clostridia bacterium]|nr:trypsin-like peptidase domain-containing protein [Clostridia bacterium]
MLKRLLILLLALMLLLPAAQADAPGSAALYLLVEQDAQGTDTPVGTAVLFQDQSTLLTTVWAAQAEGELFAVGQGGRLRITGALRPHDDSELVLLQLEAPSPAAPLSLSTQASELTVLGHQGDQVVSGLIAYPTYGYYGELPAAIFTAPAPLMPGSVLLNSYGELAGITLATHLEGINRYVALTSEEILAEFSNAGAKTDGVTWLKGFTVTPDIGQVTVDWAAALPECPEEDCVISLFFADASNPYFSYLTPEEGTSFDLCLTPGRTYDVWVQHAHGEIAITAQRPREYAITATVGETEPFSLFDYQDHEIYLGSVPLAEAETALTQKVPPLERITKDALTDPDTAIFLQVFSSYTIEETSEADLLLTLFTPEGYAFDHLGLFIFDTSLQNEDVWNVDITALFDDYTAFSPSGEMQSGDYALHYYLDGALANELRWTLE